MSNVVDIDDVIPIIEILWEQKDDKSCTVYIKQKNNKIFMTSLTAFNIAKALLNVGMEALQADIDNNCIPTEPIED